MINVNLSLFERELFCIMAETQYIQAEMFSLIPFQIFHLEKRQNIFSMCILHPQRGKKNIQLLHASKMWSLCSVPRYEIAVGDITVCKTACLLCNIPVISHRGETSLPMYNNKYASEPLRRCLFRLVVALLLRPSHWICKYTHTLQQKTYQRCACVKWKLVKWGLWFA